MGINFVNYDDIPEWIKIDRPLTEKEKMFKTAPARMIIKDLHFDVEGNIMYFRKIKDFLKFIFPNKTKEEMKKTRIINKIFCQILKGQILFYGCVLIKYDFTDPEEQNILQLELF